MSKVISVLLLIFLSANTVLGQEKAVSVSKQNVKVPEKSVPKQRVASEEIATEALATDNEQKAIEQLKILLKKYKGTPTEASLLFRLAELYMNKAKSSRAFEIFYEDAKDGENQAAASFIPKNILGKEKLFILEAIKVYDLIEENHPEFSQMDMVIYNNGYAHLQAEMKAGAEIVFTRMLKNKRLRDSAMIPDALLALGELAFQQNNFAKGLAFFELIRKYPESKVLPYGIYKSAWCHYNMKSPEKALSTMEEVIAIGHRVEKEGGDLKLDIRKEGLSDMALFFSEAKASGDAIPYFVAQSQNIDPTPYLERLSKIYNKHGKIKDEEMVLLGLVKTFPKNPRKPFFHKRLAETYDSQNRIKDAVINLVKFDRTCDEVLASNEKIEDPEVEECKETVDNYSIKVAKDWVRKWKKENNEKFAIASEQAFRVHLREKHPSVENSEARYVFADLLFHLKKFADASVEYENVGKTTDDETKAHDARYAALVSHDKFVNNDWNNDNEVRLKVLAEEYLAKHPTGKHYLDVSFQVGLLDYTKQKLDLALPRFYHLGQKFPDQAKGVKSQDLYLDILNTKKDYIALQKGALEWKSLEKDPTRKKNLQTIFEQAYFSHVQIFIDEKKYDEAIALYRQFAVEHSYSDLADEAQWNIVDLYVKKDDFPGAANAFLDFYKKFPKHEKSLEALVRSADLYEQMGMPSRALEVSKILSTVDSKNAASWILLSGDFYAAFGKYFEAINEFKSIFLNPKYAAGSKVSDVAEQAIDRVTFLADQLGNDDKYINVLREMAATNIPAIYSPAISTYADVLYKNNKTAALSDWVTVGLRRDLLAADKAKLNYYHGTIREKQYLSMNVRDSDMNLLTKDIGEKSKALSAVQTSYQAAATKGGDAYTTVNSLVGLAGLYQGFVTSLNSIEGPASFSEDERMALKDELYNIVFPFEERAVETIDAALKYAQKSDLRDGSIGKIQRILDNLNMKKRNISSVDVVLPGPVFANDKGSKGAK